MARAQSAHPIPKIGWLKIQGREHTPDQLKAFREGMKALGLVEGRDFVIEERYARQRLTIEGDISKKTNKINLVWRRECPPMANN